ncbi:MAG: glycogen/starch synthase [Muribaculaceae bacterium]|nr:glycogen/starch synthase [Muribaculaceae bacterium]
MDVKKVLYVSQEIEPYVEANNLSTFSRTIAQGLQEKGAEVRTFMPRYGAINERRNQLHEVIRLSGLNIPIDDVDYPLIIKVATLQPTRLQVYFIDNDEFFDRHTIDGVLETVNDADCNDERAIFFVRGVAETVRKLRWEPSIVHAIGWLAGLVPAYIKAIYNDDPSFRTSKVIYSLVADPDIDATFDPSMIKKLKDEGFSDDQLKTLEGVTHRSLHKLAIDFADAVAVSSPDVDPELIEYAKASGKPLLQYPGECPEATGAYFDFYKSL